MGVFLQSFRQSQSPTLKYYWSFRTKSHQLLRSRQLLSRQMWTVYQLKVTDLLAEFAEPWSLGLIIHKVNYMAMSAIFAYHIWICDYLSCTLYYTLTMYSTRSGVVQNTCHSCNIHIYIHSYPRCLGSSTPVPPTPRCAVWWRSPQGRNGSWQHQLSPPWVARREVPCELSWCAR